MFQRFQNRIVASDQKAQEIRRMREMYTIGSLNRRSFMQGVMALGIGAAAAEGLVFGSTKALADTPKKGGRIRAAMGAHGPADTLDPAKMVAGIDNCRGNQIYNKLVELDERITPQPSLAESWEPSNAAKSWIFKLRKGVTFSNGKSFDAKDVVYSLQRHLEESIGSTGKSFVEEIDTIKIDDSHTVRIDLKGSNADFPVNLGVYQMAIVPDGHTDFNGDPVGTGPFVMKEFKPGIRSVAVRNKNYWRDGYPHADEIEWFGITDPSARVNALLTGDIHLMTELDTKSVKQIQETDGVHVLSTRAGQYANFVMMRDQAPFDNIDVVTGIKYLLDREKVVKRILKGYGMTGNDHPISPVDPMYCEELPIRGQDLDKAKHHFDKAGLGSGPLEVFASSAAHSNAVDIALMIQREARKIGFDLQVNRAPSDGYWSDVWMKKPFHMSGWNMRPTANVMLTLTSHSQAKWNESQFKNERFDKLLTEARGITDQAIRKEMYCEMQTIVHNEAGLGIPAFVDYLDAASDKIKGVSKVPLGPLGGYTFAETAWIDS